MAAATTTTTSTYGWRDCQKTLAQKRNLNQHVVSFGSARGKRGFTIIVRSTSSGNESSSSSTSTAATETEKAEEEESSEVEVQKEAISLISALNVEKALRGIPISDVDHYGTLGLQKGCSYEQVTDAYKKKLEQVMNEGLDEEELSKRVELLKESHSILSSVEERRLYDWSLARDGNPETYVWPFEVDITQTPTGTPPPQEEEDVGPTRLVGYFFLGWIVLGFTLSIAFNR